MLSRSIMMFLSWEDTWRAGNVLGHSLHLHTADWVKSKGFSGRIMPPQVHNIAEAKVFSSVGSLHLTHSQPKCFPLNSPIPVSYTHLTLPTKA